MSWELTGNAGTNPAVNFLGTTDKEPLIIKTNGAEQLRIDVVGHVGIGTATPGASLEVAGTGAKFSGTIATETHTDANLYLGVLNSTPRIIFGGSTPYEIENNGNLRFLMRGDVDPLMVIDSSRNVEIFYNATIDGTTSMNTVNVETIYFHALEGFPAHGIQQDLFGRLAFSRPGVSDMVIDSSGNVGIGTTTPSEKLTVISHSPQHSGVSGVNDAAGGSGAGVYGESTAWDGVHGISHSSQHAGVSGTNDAGGPGVWAISTGGPAGYFLGDVVVTGNVRAFDVTLSGADFAEEFDVAATAEAEPGTVMVLDQHGALRPSQQAYDKRVAGVISGAGDYKPGLILDKKESSKGRMPVALVGKVSCKVDAQYTPIEMGDLLTTSPTPGHAMKATNPFQAFGAVIGKALRPLEAGQGLIPILVALQ